LLGVIAVLCSKRIGERSAEERLLGMLRDAADADLAPGNLVSVFTL
jgi:hypothetical protein